MSSASDTDSDVSEVPRRTEPLQPISQNEQADTRTRRSSSGMRPNFMNDEQPWEQRDWLGYSGVASSSSSTSRPVRPNHIDPSRYGPVPFPTLNMSEGARRQTMIAMDRKRRLTSSIHDSAARRRNPSAAFGEREDLSHNRPSEAYSTTSRPPGVNSRHRYGDSSGQEVIDLTSSPPQRPNSPPGSTRRPSGSTSAMYVLPQWQPDSEASECPICKRPFTFLFRRHHCRKCGRVVCNDCSPHRITIPRQYIVNPPGPLIQMSSEGRNTIDLTGDDEDDEDEDETHLPSLNSLRQSRRLQNTNIGGGEKVRLCNPCVPDPQPVPQSNYASPPLSSSASLNRREDLLTLSDALRGSRHDFHNHNALEQFPGFIQQQNPAYTTPSSRVRPVPLQPPLRAETLLEPAHFNTVSYPANERYRQRGYMSFENPQPIHHRHFPSDASRMPPQTINRPRVRSMLEESYVPRMFSGHLPPPRPRLTEEDICPICRRALPPKGPGGDESARESHIMECISARDPSHQSSSVRGRTAPQSPPRGPMHMLPFIATEKDCVGEDGNIPECSICMVEYDVGDELARLECLCKFHRECISEWFTRKQECPVHKIS